MSKQRRLDYLNDKIVDLQFQVDEWKRKIEACTDKAEIKSLRMKRDSTQSGIRHARQEIRLIESGSVQIKRVAIKRPRLNRPPAPVIEVETSSDESSSSSESDTEDEPSPPTPHDGNGSDIEDDGRPRSFTKPYSYKDRRRRKYIADGATFPRSPNPFNSNASRQTLPAYFGPVSGKFLVENSVYSAVKPEFWYLVPVDNGFKIDLSRSYLLCDSVPSILCDPVISRGLTGNYIGSTGVLQVGYCGGTYAFLPRPLDFKLP